MPSYTCLSPALFLGPQPDAADLAAAAASGIRTVLDLRMPAETGGTNELQTRAHGLRYSALPVDRTDLRPAQVDEFARLLRDLPGPVLLHCATGARAALLLALARARAHGWNATRTFAEAAALGFDLRTTPPFAAFVEAVTAANGG